MLCEAALAELAEVGYGGFTIGSVSARSGVARSTIYRHWPDKLALIADALESLNRQPPSAGAPAGQSSRQRIHQLVRHLAEVFDGSILSDCVPALIEGAERHREVRQFHHRFNEQRRTVLVGAIAEGVAAGEIPGHVDPEMAALALVGSIVYQRVMTSHPFDPRRVDELITTVLGDPSASHPPREATQRIPGADLHGCRLR